jgi:sulfite dehydrogenase (cytochrome) subunit B
MRLALLRIALIVFAIPLMGAAFGKVSITLPRETFGFKPGPGADLATGNCTTCHSALYVYTQPRLTRAQWTAEVNKMKAVYGAPLAPENIPGIVDYLMTQNGKP